MWAHLLPFRVRMIRVLVVDDQRIFRTAISRSLDAIPGISVVGEASDGSEAVEKAVHLQPDVVLMDVAMPGINGVDATRRISEQCPQTQIIGLSMHDSSVVEQMMRRAGAVAYIPKARHLETLVSTIYEVQRSDWPEPGGSYWD